MIKLIAIVDKNMGVADEHGIPWPPVDQAYFRQQTKNQVIVMGFGMYRELPQPLPDRQNMVLVRPGTNLRPGFQPIQDLSAFLKEHQNQTVWIVGGAATYVRTIDLADQVYLTRLDQAFKTTKFFPALPATFKLVERSPDQHKKDLAFHFEVWQREKEPAK